MYEVTVSAPQTENYLMQYYFSKLSPKLTEMDGIITEVNNTNRNYCSVACSDTFRFQLQRYVKQTVTEVLSLGYKNIYFRNLLNVDINNFCQNALVNTLCVFDNEIDVDYISRLVDVNKSICLDGYYNFRIKTLKNKWHEVYNLMCENVYLLNDDNLILDFFHYLLDTMTARHKVLSVNITDNGFTLFDSADNAIDCLQSLSPKYDMEQEIILNAICSKPKMLKIYSKSKPSADFCKMADELFKTMYVCVN